MRVLWDTLHSSTSLPIFLLEFRAPPFSLSLFLFLHWSFLSKLFIQGTLSWWWSFFFHGLLHNGWRLLSPLLLYLPLHLHGGKSPLKDLIEAQRSSFHRSFTSKLPSHMTSIYSLSVTQNWRKIWISIQILLEFVEPNFGVKISLIMISEFCSYTLAH